MNKLYRTNGRNDKRKTWRRLLEDRIMRPLYQLRFTMHISYFNTLHLLPPWWHGVLGPRVRQAEVGGIRVEEKTHQTVILRMLYSFGTV